MSLNFELPHIHPRRTTSSAHRGFFNSLLTGPLEYAVQHFDPFFELQPEFTFSKHQSDCVTSNKPPYKPLIATLLIRLTWPRNLWTAWSTVQTLICTALALLHAAGAPGLIQFCQCPCSLPLLGLYTHSSSDWNVSHCLRSHLYSPCKAYFKLYFS